MRWFLSMAHASGLGLYVRRSQGVDDTGAPGRADTTPGGAETPPRKRTQTDPGKGGSQFRVRGKLRVFHAAMGGVKRSDTSAGRKRPRAPPISPCKRRSRPRARDPGSARYQVSWPESCPVSPDSLASTPDGPPKKGPVESPQPQSGNALVTKKPAPHRGVWRALQKKTAEQAPVGRTFMSLSRITWRPGFGGGARKAPSYHQRARRWLGAIGQFSFHCRDACSIERSRLASGLPADLCSG